MALLKDVEFICLDVEATGLDLENDRIIELAAVTFTEDEILQEFETLINPEREIPKESQAIHNISEDMVQGQPTIGKVLLDFFKFVGRRPIIGHGIQFDIDMLRNEAKRVGVPFPLGNNKVIDTLRLARHYGESPSNSLETLRHHFNITPEGAHRAKSDVVVNIQVFRKLTRKFKTTEEIDNLLSRPIYMKIMPLGKHKGRIMTEVPLDYLQWASHQNFDQDLLYSIRTEVQRRRKGSGFAQTSNPFHAL